MRPNSRSDGPRYSLAREKAAALLALRHQQSPVDVAAIAAAAGIPIVQRDLPTQVRGTVGDIGGRRAIVLNRRWQFSSDAERRWVLAEELGHILLDHRLVESTAPGTSPALLEWQRTQYEREARAIAAELLMPLARVRERWFMEASGVHRALSLEERKQAQERIGRKLARAFGVTPSAMRIRLEELKLGPG